MKPAGNILSGIHALWKKNQGKKNKNDMAGKIWIKSYSEAFTSPTYILLDTLLHLT